MAVGKGEVATGVDIRLYAAAWQMRHNDLNLSGHPIHGSNLTTPLLQLTAAILIQTQTKFKSRNEPIR